MRNKYVCFGERFVTQLFVTIRQQRGINLIRMTGTILYILYEMQLEIMKYFLIVEPSKTVTPSTPQKADSEPLRAIENISTTITPSLATSSTISTTTTTASAINSASEDDASTTVATIAQSPATNSILAKSEKELLPKAMIKPNNVLTHVIGNFVIQESNEPFPVTRQRYADDADDTPGESQRIIFMHGWM